MTNNAAQITPNAIFQTFENEYFYLGYCYQKQQDFKKALWYYKKAILHDENHLEANYQIILFRELHETTSCIEPSTGFSKNRK